MSDKLKIKIHGYRKLPVLQELIDEFLRPSDYELLPDDGFRRDAAVHINLRESADKDEIKREIFDRLSELTGIRPDWGILPVSGRSNWWEKCWNAAEIGKRFSGR